jgi:transcriptional regulator with XRE-family HTH domain
MDRKEHPIRAWRIENRLTLGGLAQMINKGQRKPLCGVAHLSQIEARGKSPSVKLARRLANVTGLPLEQVVGS